MEQFLSFDPDTRKPSIAPPPLSCDSQAHFFNTSPRFPVAPSATYVPPDATISDLLKMHRTLGIERGVLVQPTVYTTDNSLLVEVLREAGPNYRGIAVLDDTVTDQELLRLHEAGVRGVRFNFLHTLGIRPDIRAFRRTLEKIKPLGWLVKTHVWGDEIIELEEVFRSIRMTALIDHMGQTRAWDMREPKPSFDVMLRLLERDNWWVMISNGDRLSESGYPWNDTIPMALRLIAAAPDRVVWATDWPHVRLRANMPNDTDLLELAYRYAPDSAIRQRLLVDNPARLFGFGKPQPS